MKLRALMCAGLMLLLATAVFAADVTGKWTAQVPGRGGQTMEQTFTFKSSGSELTGTVTGFQGNENPISNGKVDGDNISFDVKVSFGGNEIVQKYSGAVSGSEIKFKREGGRGPIEFTAKKATT